MAFESWRGVVRFAAYPGMATECPDFDVLIVTADDHVSVSTSLTLPTRCTVQVGVTSLSAFRRHAGAAP